MDKRMGRNPANLKEDNQPLSTGTIHFLGIGINDYDHWPKLNNAVRDVETITQLLQEQYDVQVWKLLRDEQATRKQIIRELNALTKQVQAPDSIIIYYAGHGHIDQETQLGAWIPIDAETVDTDLYIPNSTLRDFFQVAKAQHVLFISDACFSGSLLQERRGGEQQLLLQELAARPSRWVICSGRHDEAVADGPKGGHSPFAQAIIDELEHNQQPGINAAAFAQAVQLQCKSFYRDQLPDYGPVFNAGDKRGQLVLWRRGTAREEEEKETIIPDEDPALRQNDAEEPDANNRPTMTLSDFKRKVKGYLAKGDPKTALTFMEANLQEEASAQNTVLLLNSRLHSLRREKDAGTIGTNDAGVRSNSIIAAINSTLDDIEEEDLRVGEISIEESRSQGTQESRPQGISAAEREGIERAIALKVRIINALRDKLALEDDPIRLIRYEEQLQKAEEDLSTLKAKLA